MTQLDQAKINDIIKSFIKDSLDEEESIRINRQRPLSDDEVEQRAEFLGLLKADRREALAKSDFRHAFNLTDDAIQTHDLDIKDKGSEDYRVLSRELMKAQIAVLDVEKRRTLGDYKSPQEVALRESIDPNPWSDGKQGHRGAPEQQQNRTADVLAFAVDDALMTSKRFGNVFVAVMTIAHDPGILLLTVVRQVDRQRTSCCRFRPSSSLHSYIFISPGGSHVFQSGFTLR